MEAEIIDNKNNIDKREILQSELSFIEDIESVMNTKQGKNVILQILKMTDVLALNVFTGNAHTYYDLGKQYVGKQILWTLAKAGIKVDTVDLSKMLENSINRKDIIKQELLKIKQEESNNVRSNDRNS